MQHGSALSPKTQTKPAARRNETRVGTGEPELAGELQPPRGELQGSQQKWRHRLILREPDIPLQRN